MNNADSNAGNQQGTAAQAAPAPAPESAPAPEPAPGQRRPWQLLFCLLPVLLLVLVALWEIRASLRPGHDVPGPAAWQRAGQAVRERFQPGDLIVFAPAWIDPVGRMHLGDLMTIDMAARMDDARYGTMWELSIRGASAPESRGREVAWTGRFGELRVRKLVAEPATVVTDFLAELDRARVEGKAVGKPELVLAEVGFAPHRCVQVEPRSGETVRIIYPNVTLGSTLVGHVGLADVFTRRDVRDPGRLEVFINGQRVTMAQPGVDDGWVRFAAETRPGPGAEVVFAATAVGPRATKRLICFAAEARA